MALAILRCLAHRLAPRRATAPARIPTASITVYSTKPLELERPLPVRGYGRAR